MARRKPTRSIELTYAKVRQTNDEGTLFPCYVGPRYVLHKLDQDNTFAGIFETGKDAELLAYPNKTETMSTVIDTNNVKVKLDNIVVQVAEGLIVSSHPTAKNGIIFAQAVAGSNRNEALNGYDVRIGDMVEVNGITLNITDIRNASTGGYREVYVDNTNFTIEGDATVAIFTNTIANEAIQLADNRFTVSNDGVTLNGSSLEVIINKVTYNVKSADLHIEYKERILDDVFELISGDTDNLDAFVGEADPENPLGFFAYCAKLAKTTAFYVMAVPDDSYASYEKALNIAMRYENVFAPITYNQTDSVRQLLIQRMTEYNNPDIAQFKKLWFADDTDIYAPVYKTTSTGENLAITMGSNGAVTFTNGDIVAAGVRIGDILIIPSYYDANTKTYIQKEYVIDSIVDSDSIVVRNADITLDIATTAYISRGLSNIDYANAVGAKAVSLNSPYINYVWADSPICLGFGKTNPVYLTATLAAMRASMNPHAPMSEVTVPGWTVSDSLGLAESDLDIMNDKGVWIVHKDRYGEVVNRHQITTVQDGTLAEEDSAVSNACNIVRSLRSMLYQYRGDSNVTNELIDALNADIRQSLDRIMSRVYSLKVGKQITDYSVKDLRIDADNRARIILDVDIDVPEPLLDGHFKFNII